MDSGASHRVTSDLQNMSLHSEYDGSDDIVIGNGTSLHITHTGFTTLFLLILISLNLLPFLMSFVFHQ